jgi:hypothetical protein
MSYTKNYLRAALPAPLTADQAMLPPLSVETTRNLQTKVCRATIAVDSNTQHAVSACCIIEASLALVLAKYENSAEICFDVGKAVGHESMTVERTTHPVKIKIDRSDPIYHFLEKALDAMQRGADTEGSSFSGIINPDVRDTCANRSRAILVEQSQYNEVQHNRRIILVPTVATTNPACSLSSSYIICTLNSLWRMIEWTFAHISIPQIYLLKKYRLFSTSGNISCRNLARVAASG